MYNRPMGNEIITPPVYSTLPVVQEGRNDPNSKKDKQDEKPKDAPLEQGQTLDEWAADHTELSLKAIELQIIEDVNTILRRYTDETDIHEEMLHPVSQAYSAYQKMTHNFAEDPQDVLSPFLPDSIAPLKPLKPEEIERYNQLRVYWDAIKELRKRGIDHIDFGGEDSFYKALEKVIV